MRHGDGKQRIAIRWAFRRRIGTDQRITAGAVFDDHRFAPNLRQFLPNQSRHDVGQATRREGHDVAHGAIGEGVLGLCAANQRGGGQCGEQQATGWAHRVLLGIWAGFAALAGKRSPGRGAAL